MVEFFVASLGPALAHKGRLTTVEASLLLHRAYLLRYGLATEAELDAHPASLFRMRPAEDPHVGTQLEDHFEHFLDLEIYLFMKWNEYISLPRHEIQMIKRVAEKRRKMKNATENKGAQDLERQLQSMGLGG